MSGIIKPEIVAFPTSEYPKFDGRSVQLSLSETSGGKLDIPVFVFGSGIHAMVLAEFLVERGLKYLTRDGVVTDGQVPELTGPQYNVVGMTGVRVYNNNLVMLIKSSMDYPEMKLDRDHLGEIMKHGLIPEGVKLRY